MSERDANQLATDVRRALDEARLRTPSPPPRGTPYGDGLRDAAKTYRKADAALDELVGLVGTLQQERDECERQYQAKAAEVIKEMNRDEAAEAALATTRQALAELATATLAILNEDALNEPMDDDECDCSYCTHFRAAATLARRALADTGGDTAPQRHGRECGCTPCKAEDWDEVDRRLRDVS